MKKTIILCLISVFAYAQNNTFKIDCGIDFTVTYTGSGDTNSLHFLWEEPVKIDLANVGMPVLKPGKTLSQNEVLKLVSDHLSIRISANDISDYSLSNSNKDLDIKLYQEYRTDNILDINDAILANIHQRLILEGNKGFFTLCTFPVFKKQINENIERIKKEIVNNKLSTGLEELSKKLSELKGERKGIKGDGNFHTDDIYNPINFTTIEHRMPAENGVLKSEHLPNRASLHHIKKNGFLHIKFDKKFVEILTANNKLNLRVKAFIERKDNSVKPLAVKGLTYITSEKNDTKQNILLHNEAENTIEEKYKIDYKPSKKETLSAEVEVAFEDVSVDDIIILQITNETINGVGFSCKFVFADYGWSRSPTGGFSFLKTTGNDDKVYKASGYAGYAFRYNPKPSANFWKNFFYPSFGPELNVLQDGDNTLIGAGLFVTSFANVAKFGYGFYLNGENQKTYISIGLDVIKSYQTITDLLAKTK